MNDLSKEYELLLSVVKKRKQCIEENTGNLFYSIVDALNLMNQLDQHSRINDVSFVYDLIEQKFSCNFLGNIIYEYYTTPEDIDLELLRLLCEEENINFTYKELPDACVYLFDKECERSK